MNKFLFLSLLILLLSLALTACGSAESGGAVPIKLEYAVSSSALHSGGVVLAAIFSAAPIRYLTVPS